MLGTFTDLPTAKVEEEEKEVVWNIPKEDDWKKYEKLCNAVSDKLNMVIKNKDMNINDVMKKVDSVQTKIKFQAIGKCTIKPAVKTNNSIVNENNVNEGGQEEEKAKLLLKKQSSKIEEEIDKIKFGRNKVGQIFQIAKLTKGLEKSAGKAHAIKHPINGNLIVDQKQIKQVSVEYCKEVLKKNEPSEKFIAMAKLKEQLHNKRMGERLGEGFMAKKEVFEKVLYKFKRMINGVMTIC